MALSNKERVGRILDTLIEGLAPYVVREYRMIYKSDYTREIDASLTTKAFGLPHDAFKDDDTLIGHLDAQNTLNLMIRRWHDVFQNKLGHPGRNYVGEMMSARITWAHQKPFTNDEAYRVADTAARLLKMVSAGDQAAIVEETAKELLRLRYEAEVKKAKKINSETSYQPEPIYEPLQYIDNTSFIGRDQQLKWLVQKIIDEGHKLVGIVGSPGTGKSSLAQRFADLNKGDFERGIIGISVYLQPTSSTQEYGLDETVDKFIQLAKLPEPENTHSASEKLNAAFKGKKFLLILDNADDAEFAELKSGLQESTLVITSRDNLVPGQMGVPSECILNLSADENQLDEQSCVDIMYELFAAENLGYIIKENESLVRELVNFIGYLPLGITLIAKDILETYSINTLDDDSEDTRVNDARQNFANYVTYLYEDREQRGVTLNQIDAVFSRSLQSLERRLRGSDGKHYVQLFCTLGVCVPQGFDRKTALAVSGIDKRHVERGLGNLRRLSLLRGNIDNRMSFHPIVRDFARLRAQESGLYNDALSRYARYVVDHVIEANQDAVGSDLDSDMVPITLQVEQQLDEIWLAAEWLVENSIHDLNTTREFWRGIRSFFETRSYNQRAVQFLESVVKYIDIQVVENPDDIKFLEYQGYFYRQLGKAYYQYRHIRTAKKNLKLAKRTLQKGLEIERQIQNLEGQVKALTSLARIYTVEKKLEKALEVNRESLAISERLQEPKNLVYSLSVLSLTLIKTREQAAQNEAIEHMERALVIAQKLNDPHQTVICLSQYMQVLASIGEFQEIISKGEDALQLLDNYQIDSPRSARTVVRMLMQAYSHKYATQKIELRKRIVYDALNLFRLSDSRKQNELYHIIRTYDLKKPSREQAAEAYPYCQMHLELSEKLVGHLLWSLYRIGTAALYSNRAREALVHFRRFLAILEEPVNAKSSPDQINIQERYGYALWDTGSHWEAITNQYTLYKEVFVKRRELHDDAERTVVELAHWLYRYSLYIFNQTENDDTIQSVGRLFQELRTSNLASTYVLFEYGRYLETIGRNHLILSLEDVNHCLRLIIHARRVFAKVYNAARREEEERLQEIAEDAQRRIEWLTEYKKRLLELEKLLDQLDVSEAGHKLLLEIGEYLNLHLRNPRAAKVFFERIVKEDDSGSVDRELGRINRKLGSLKMAGEHFRNALSKKPDQFDYRRDYADFLAGTDLDTDKAIEQYRRAGKIVRNTNFSNYGIAVMYWKHMELPSAASFFDKALDGLDLENPHYEEIICNSLRFLVEQQETVKVQSLLGLVPPNLLAKPLVAIEENEARFFLKQQGIADTLGIYEEITESIRKKLEDQERRSRQEQKPNLNLNYRHDLAYCNWRAGLFCETHSEVEKAGENYEFAYQLSQGSDWDFLANFTLWHFRYGRRVVAESLLEELIYCNPNHPAITLAEQLQDRSQ